VTDPNHPGVGGADDAAAAAAAADVGVRRDGVLRRRVPLQQQT
jgi:hypothetical protein